MFVAAAAYLGHMDAGECAARKEESTLMDFTIDIPFDGLGLIGFPASDAISPVYTLWVTLVFMYLGTIQEFSILRVQYVESKLQPITQKTRRDLWHEILL